MDIDSATIDDSGEVLTSACGVSRAAEMMRGLGPGRRLVGVSKGQFSSIDLVEAGTAIVGPAHLLVTTWTIGRRDAEVLARLVRDGRLLSVRVLCDRSFPTRHPDRLRRVVEALSGVLDVSRDIALTRTHAKFWVLTGGRHPMACRTSMNLNTNRRFECFDIDCDERVSSFLIGVADEVLSGGWEPAVSEVGERFERAMGGVAGGRSDAAGRQLASIGAGRTTVRRLRG